MKFHSRETLTTEALRKVFPNNFKLANQAIGLCRYYIRSGHEVALDEILAEVLRNPGEEYVHDLMALEKEDEDGSIK